MSFSQWNSDTGYDITHCITMFPTRLYPEYDFYNGDIDINWDEMSSHKKIFLTITVFIIISLTPLLLYINIKK